MADAKVELDEFGIPRMEQVDAPPEPEAIPLYPDLAPGPVGESWYEAGGTALVRNVSQPTLTPVLPDPAKATGEAVIVVPGGGFMILAIGHEGWMVAPRLAERGIAAFVLKYRVNDTPQDEAGFQAMMRQRMGALVAPGAATPVPELKEPRATEDALQAVRMVRANAEKWRIDPRHVGMLGFSAGAIIAIEAGIAPAAADKPDFIASFYPSLAARPVPADAPPLFLAIAFDDMYFARQKLGIIEAWREAGRPVEFHGFQTGGHGFGLGRPGTSTSLVFDQFLLWMRTVSGVTPG
jgi:acetyl esterase/lipase